MSKKYIIYDLESFSYFENYEKVKLEFEKSFRKIIRKMKLEKLNNL